MAADQTYRRTEPERSGSEIKQISLLDPPILPTGAKTMVREVMEKWRNGRELIYLIPYPIREIRIINFRHLHGSCAEAHLLIGEQRKIALRREHPEAVMYKYRELGVDCCFDDYNAKAGEVFEALFLD